MSSLKAIRDRFIAQGLRDVNADARAAQSVLLPLLAQSDLQQRITIKGGVLIQQLSKDLRRATRDIDFDLVRYPIEKSAIVALVEKLDAISDEYSVSVSKITELKHQDYQGKRAVVTITDSDGFSISSKLDIGVHTYAQLEQESLVFELDMVDESVSLLANTPEQIVAEKLKSLLRLGSRSTRTKDLFDIYYLLVDYGVSESKLKDAVQVLVFNDESMFENNWDDVQQQLRQTFRNPRFKSRVNEPGQNWLDIDIDVLLAGILDKL